MCLYDSPRECEISCIRSPFEESHTNTFVLSLVWQVRRSNTRYSTLLRRVIQTHLYYPWFDKYGDLIHDIPHSRGESCKHICIILGLTSMEIEYTIFHTPEESHTNTFVLSLVWQVWRSNTRYSTLPRRVMQTVWLSSGVWNIVY
jgi:hypothetical protein